MPNLFEKIWDEWLFGPDKSYNPFLKALREGMKGCRVVDLPEISQDQKEFRAEQDGIAISEDN